MESLMSPSGMIIFVFIVSIIYFFLNIELFTIFQQQQRSAMTAQLQVRLTHWFILSCFFLCQNDMMSVNIISTVKYRSSWFFNVYVWKPWLIIVCLYWQHNFAKTILWYKNIFNAAKYNKDWY